MNSVFHFRDGSSEEEGEMTLPGHVTWIGVGMHGWNAFLIKHCKPTSLCNSTTA